MSSRVKLPPSLRLPKHVGPSIIADASLPVLHPDDKPDPLLFSKFIKAVYNTSDPSAPESMQDKQMKVFERVPGYVHPKALQAKVVDAQRILFLEKIEAEEQSKLQLPTVRTEGAAIDPFSRVTSRDEETKRIYLLLKHLPAGRSMPLKLRLPKLPSESSRVEYSTGVDTVVETLPSTQRDRAKQPKSYGDQSKQSQSVSRIRGFAHQLVETAQTQVALKEQERRRQQEADEIPSPEEVHRRLLEKRLRVDSPRSASRLLHEDPPNASGEYFGPSDRQVKKKLIGNVREIRKELQRARLQHLMSRDQEEAVKILAARQKAPPPELFDQHVKEIKKVLRSRRILNQDKLFLGEEQHLEADKHSKRLEQLTQREQHLKTSAQIVHRLIEERLHGEAGSLSSRSTRPSQTLSHRVVVTRPNRSKIRLEVLSTDATHRERTTDCKLSAQKQPNADLKPNPPLTENKVTAFKDRISETLRLLDKKQRANLREKMRIERTARRIDRELGVFGKIKVDEFVKGCEDLELMSGVKVNRKR